MYVSQRIFWLVEKIKRAKGNNLTRCNPGNLIPEQTVSRGYVRNKVDLEPLACENNDLMQAY